MGVFASKQSWEEFSYGFNFTADLNSEEEISSADVKAYDDETGEDATSSLIDSDKQVIEDQNVYIRVKGGVSGKVYKITCQATGANGSKPELDGFIKIVDI